MAHDGLFFIHSILPIRFCIYTSSLSMSSSWILGVRFSSTHCWWGSSKFKISYRVFLVSEFKNTGFYILFRGITVRLLLKWRIVSTFSHRENIAFINSRIFKFILNFLFVPLHLYFKLHIYYLFSFWFVSQSLFFTSVDRKSKLLFGFVMQVVHGFLELKLLLLLSK
jgi:hypothetical protein